MRRGHSLQAQLKSQGHQLSPAPAKQAHRRAVDPQEPSGLVLLQESGVGGRDQEKCTHGCISQECHRACVSSSQGRRSAVPPKLKDFTPRKIWFDSSLGPKTSLGCFSARSCCGAFPGCSWVGVGEPSSPSLIRVVASLPSQDLPQAVTSHSFPH